MVLRLEDKFPFRTASLQGSSDSFWKSLGFIPWVCLKRLKTGWSRLVPIRLLICYCKPWNPLWTCCLDGNAPMAWCFMVFYWLLLSLNFNATQLSPQCLHFNDPPTTGWTASTTALRSVALLEGDLSAHLRHLTKGHPKHMGKLTTKTTPHYPLQNLWYRFKWIGIASQTC